MLSYSIHKKTDRLIGYGYGGAGMSFQKILSVIDWVVTFFHVEHIKFWCFACGAMILPGMHLMYFVFCNEPKGLWFLLGLLQGIGSILACGFLLSLWTLRPGYKVPPCPHHEDRCIILGRNDHTFFLFISGIELLICMGMYEMLWISVAQNLGFFETMKYLGIL